MNIIEAMKSGLKYRRKGEELWYETTEDYRDYTFPVRAVLADDWEVEEKSVTITREQFNAAWARSWGFDNRWAASNLTMADLLAKELGL